MSWEADTWQRALVYGLGISGKAAARLLRSRGVEVVGVDRRGVEDLKLGDLADDPGGWLARAKSRCSRPLV